MKVAVRAQNLTNMELHDAAVELDDPSLAAAVKVAAFLLGGDVGGLCESLTRAAAKLDGELELPSLAAAVRVARRRLEDEEQQRREEAYTSRVEARMWQQSELRNAFQVDPEMPQC